jgi:hypothetical protein
MGKALTYPMAVFASIRPITRGSRNFGTYVKQPGHRDSS